MGFARRAGIVALVLWAACIAVPGRGEKESSGGVYCSEKNCRACQAEGCEWCVPVLTYHSSKNSLSLHTVGGECVATAAACHRVRFGELAKLFNFKASSHTVSLLQTQALKDQPHAECTEVDSDPAVTEHRSCNTCVAEESVWCPLNLTVKVSGTPPVTNHGGVCVSNADQCSVAGFPFFSLLSDIGVGKGDVGENISVGDGCGSSTSASSSCLPIGPYIMKFGTLTSIVIAAYFSL